jgi:hypothetical protein
MPSNASYLKALLVTEDIRVESFGFREYTSRSFKRVQKENTFTLQHYSYKCGRTRNEYGRPYGGTTPSLLHLTVRVADEQSCRVFYQQLQSEEVTVYSILFNASFDERKELAGYDSAQIIHGFLVDITEEFVCSSNEQMCLTLSFLISRISYLGENDNEEKVLSITQ